MGQTYPDGESPDDLVVLRDALMEWLLELAVADRDEIERLLTSPKQDETVEERRWAVAASLWSRHGVAHSTKGEEECTESPCRIEYVSLALAEVCFYRNEVFATQNDPRRALAEIAMSMRNQERNIAALAEHAERGAAGYKIRRQYFKPEFVPSPEGEAWYGYRSCLACGARLPT